MTVYFLLGMVSTGFAVPKCVLKWVVTIVEFLEVLATEIKKKNIFEQIAQIMFLNTAG